MIYLKVSNGKVEAFGDIDTMKFITGADTPDKTITEETWSTANSQAWLVDGKIVLGPDDAALFVSLRHERAFRLQSTDYLLLPDYPINEDARTRIIAYRQALRDLPSQPGAPWDGGGQKTPWPEFPEI